MAFDISIRTSDCSPLTFNAGVRNTESLNFAVADRPGETIVEKDLSVNVENGSTGKVEYSRVMGAYCTVSSNNGLLRIEMADGSASEGVVWAALSNGEKYAASVSITDHISLNPTITVGGVNFQPLFTQANEISGGIIKDGIRTTYWGSEMWHIISLPTTFNFNFENVVPVIPNP